MKGDPLNSEGTEKRGLTTAEAEALLKKFGPNAIEQEKPHPLWQLVKRFWAPVPWLLEATIILQLVLGERLEATVICGLLVLNAFLGSLQEARAQRALALLQQQLRILARVCRDGVWKNVPAEDLVIGDIIHLRQGGIVPADVTLTTGSLLVDQSALTGESAAVSVEAGKTAYTGSMVRGGEASGEITATGRHTFFGKTAELVRTARSAHRQEHEITAVARNLFAVNGAMMIVVIGYAHLAGMTISYVLPLLLTILLASIPVALPAMFTLTAALGSVELSRNGVLVTRLSALHDFASVTVFCTDKTGTLTRNESAVGALWAAPGSSEDEVLRAAALASDPAGQDLVDGAIVSAASNRGWHPPTTRVSFQAFDPTTKRAEAVYQIDGVVQRYVKGAPAVVAAICNENANVWQPQAELISSRGQRVLAAASGNEHQLHFVGLLGLEDGVRADSRAVVQAINGSGVRVVMVTGDNALTARSVAEQVDIPPKICPPEKLKGNLQGDTLEYSVFAGVYPEDKHKLVRAFQRHGEIVAMSGDGVNDAPALRQAEAGVALANATDVAKAAAALVLTHPGLPDIIPAIQTSRLVFQRMMTYTLNMLAKKFELMLLLMGGFLLTQHRPLTPLMMVLFIFLNDFLTMAFSTDKMAYSPKPNRWKTNAIVLAAAVVGGCKLIFSLGFFCYGYFGLRFDADHLRTLTFAAVFFGSQAGVYLLRERKHFWDSRPGRFLLMSSVFGTAIVIILTVGGIFMAPISAPMLATVAAVAVLYFSTLDWLKVWLFRRLELR